MGAIADAAESVFSAVDSVVSDVMSNDRIGQMIQLGAGMGIGVGLGGGMAQWFNPETAMVETVQLPGYDPNYQYVVNTNGGLGGEATVTIDPVAGVPGDAGQVTDSFSGGNYEPPVNDYSGGFPNYDPSAAMGGATAAQAGGMASPGLLGPLNDALATLNKNLGTNITLKDIGTAGANWLVQNQLANRLEGVANKAASLSNPLDAPQRQPYQGMLSQLLTNPQQFYATNPVVQGQLDLAKNQFNANAAKLGTGGTVFNDYLKNVQNIASGTFNDQASLLAGLGGFNQGPGYSGVTYGSNAGAAATARTQGLYGLGQMVARNPFESPMQGQTGTSNVPGGGRIV